jgi:GNAT superfamily N-acetyltransferase
MDRPSLRPATEADVDAIATVWHEAWHDAHAEHVPACLVADRTPAHFRRCATDLAGSVIVAEDSSGIVGFVRVDTDELDLLFVARRGRGTGVAAALLARGEEEIADRFPKAWLEVVSGNDRARRFYARMGWVDAGMHEWTTETSAGPATVTYRRYEKRLHA